jgi:hypothetical protein
MKVKIISALLIIDIFYLIFINDIFCYNPVMIKKIALTLTLLSQLCFAATPEQVEQYLTISNSEEELLALESQFSSMQSGFSRDENSSEDKTYDMQMLSIRFKDYIQKHLSEDEMTEVLENYKNVVLLQFVSASSASQHRDRNETSNYIKTLKANPEAGIRIELIEKISKKLYSKDSMTILFDELMKPLMENGIGGGNMNEEMLKGAKENYLKTMLEASTEETIYAAKDFSLEELEELLKIVQTPAIEHESKAVFGAMAYSLKEFFMSMTSRYDVSKHQPKGTADINHSK